MSEFPKSWTVVLGEKDGQNWWVRNHQNSDRTFLREVGDEEFSAYVSALTSCGSELDTIHEILSAALDERNKAGFDDEDDICFDLEITIDTTFTVEDFWDFVLDNEEMGDESRSFILNLLNDNGIKKD